MYFVWFEVFDKGGNFFVGDFCNVNFDYVGKWNECFLFFFYVVVVKSNRIVKILNMFVSGY